MQDDPPERNANLGPPGSGELGGGLSIVSGNKKGFKINDVSVALRNLRDAAAQITVLTVKNHGQGL